MTVSEAETGADPGVARHAGKYLTFRLGDEEYGLEILKVQEIIGMMHVTRVPRTPDFLRGVINLRGKIVPVVDLRRKFGLESREDTDRTCIIVVQLGRGGRTTTVGIIVDEVSEVMDIAADQLEPTPSVDFLVGTDFILGIGKIGQKVIVLLDIDRVLSSGEVSLLGRVTEEAPAQAS